MPVKDYSGRWRVVENDLCYPTECPECGELVFFIRHNGGCCWIDPPLGPPWYKHSCFDVDYIRCGERKSLCDMYNIELKGLATDEHRLCVVISSDVSWPKEVTKVEACMNRGVGFVALVKGNAGYLTSKMCIYDSLKNIIYPIAEQQYVFSVIAALGSSDNEDTIFACPKCNEQVPFKGLQKHMEAHYYKSKFPEMWK